MDNEIYSNYIHCYIHYTITITQQQHNTDFLLLMAPVSAGLSLLWCPVGTLCSCTYLIVLDCYFCVTNKLDWIGWIGDFENGILRHTMIAKSYKYAFESTKISIGRWPFTMRLPQTTQHLGPPGAPGIICSRSLCSETTCRSSLFRSGKSLRKNMEVWNHERLT